MQTEENIKLANALQKLGVFLYDNERRVEALAMVQEQIAVAESLVQEDNQKAEYLWKLGNAKCGLGMVRRELTMAGWEEAIRSGNIYI